MIEAVTFIYTKDDGDVSERTLLVTAKPQANISGIDISKLSLIDQANFVIEMKKAHDIYMGMVKLINSEFDTENSYRQFKPANISSKKVLDIKFL